MNIAGTEYNLKNKTFDIFVSGCIRGCRGCFNPEAQDFNFGEKLDGTALFAKIKENIDIINSIRIMGGDLLCQSPGEARFFTENLKHKFIDKELVLYTGAKINEIPRWCFGLFDKIKYGPYIEELKCDNELYGSSNQGILNKGIDY